jgi:hypothetical protein
LFKKRKEKEKVKKEDSFYYHIPTQKQLVRAEEREDRERR